MTDKFMKYVKNNFEDWKKIEEERVKKHNAELQKKIDIHNRIHELLKEKDVEEFSKLIGYEEKKVYGEFENNDNLLFKFLRNHENCPKWTMEELMKDKYLVLCNMFNVAEINAYCSLQDPLNHFWIGDNKKCDNKWEKFIESNKDKIIYAPNGKIFLYFGNVYSVQAEYVEEALKTNQENAKKLILSKYGRK